jgi:two-component system, sensor histidine kinase and response regulator
MAIDLRPTPFQKYAVAVGAVTLAFVLRYTIYGTLDHRLPFSFFTTATLIAAWYGGLGPGMLAAMSGLLLGDYFFLPKHDSGSTMSEAVRTAIGIYALTNTLIVVLFWNLHSRLRYLEGKLGAAKPEKQD